MNQTGSQNGNQPNVPQARAALDNMKFEIARELGINFKQGYNGDLTSRETRMWPSSRCSALSAIFMSRWKNALPGAST